MKWVTRKRIHVNRTATGWLIRRFLDPSAEILFVEPEEVASIQQREGAVGFDAPGARHPHKDAAGRCSFEQLVEPCGRDRRSRAGPDRPRRRLSRKRSTPRPNRRASGRSVRDSRTSPPTMRRSWSAPTFLYDSL